MKNKLSKKIIILLLISIMMFVLTGCIPGDGSYTMRSPAGLLSGVWHGWIAPVSLILSLFDNTTRIYEVANTGFWYDFGFYMAIISGFGGLSLSRTKAKKNRRRK